MARPRVSITSCETYDPVEIRACLLRHFELLGGIEKFVSPGQRVLIKPNLIAPRPRHLAVQTDPGMIIALAEILVDYGAKPFVADSPAWADVESCAGVLGLFEPLSRLGVAVKQLDVAVTCELASGTKVGISALALEADKIINLPKLKSHQQLGATIAVKNMFGCVSGKAKALWHFRKGGDCFDFCKMLIEIYNYLSPAVTIIDSVLAMEGAGPVRGEPREIGWIVASEDPIAAERICCELTGFCPEELPIMVAAERLGFGASDISEIEIAGDDYSGRTVSDFVKAEPIPLRFSFGRIVKSVLRQMYLLATSKR